VPTSTSVAAFMEQPEPNDIRINYAGQALCRRQANLAMLLNRQPHADTPEVLKYSLLSRARNDFYFSFQQPRLAASFRLRQHVFAASCPCASKPGYYRIILVDVSRPGPHNAR
jgi:hypothetical protein